MRSIRTALIALVLAITAILIPKIALGEDTQALQASELVAEDSLATEAVPAADVSGRATKTINEAWLFYASNVGESGWEFPVGGSTGLVNLPHCWQYTHPTLSNIPIKNQQTACYVKRLDVSAVQGKRVFIRFNGASKNTTLYVDGQKIGTHVGGYSAFTFDLTDYVQGKYQVTVKAEVTNIDTASIPVNVDWIQWGGIYRDVELITTSNQYISTENYASNGVFVDYSLNGSTAQTKTRVDLSNHSSEAANLTVKATTTDASGNVVSSSERQVTVPGNTTSQEYSLDQTIRSIRRWNGIADPYQYIQKVELIADDGSLLDSISQKIGFRTFQINDGSCYLNGSKIEIHGVGYHQDRKSKGNAVSKADMAEDIDTMLEMGVNAVRAAHYPHDKYFYDLCNEKGILVYTEIPYYLTYSKAQSFRDSVTNELKEMIRQLYNEPSIVIWGIQNELIDSLQVKAFGEEFDATNAEIAEFTRGIAELAHAEDPSRLVSQACMNKDAYLELDSMWDSAIDVEGLNIYTYNEPSDFSDSGRAKARDAINSRIDEVKSIMGVSDLLITEYGARGSVNQHSELNNLESIPSDYLCEEMQAASHENYYTVLSERNDIPMAFAWNMFDFACYRNEADSKQTNTKGLVAYDHATKKDVFYFYKANWNKSDKFVHLTSKRYLERTEPKQDIKVYSNCENVELFLNGESLGYGRTTCSGAFEWSGVNIGDSDWNSLKAVGYDGSGVYTDSIDGIKCLFRQMYRLYNPYTGEHFYTSDNYEKSTLEEAGWQFENIGWIAPSKSSTPVYRLYNSYVPGGDHHYTTDFQEYQACIRAGWTGEDIGWYSDDNKGVALLREYNPFAMTGTHNYTRDAHEHETLIGLGWKDEGIAWYGESR